MIRQEQKFLKYQERKKRMEAEISIRTYKKVRQFLRPILRKLLYVQRKINGFTVECLNEIHMEKEEALIIAVTHIGKWDFEIINEKIEYPFWVLAADYIHMHKGLNALFLNANGIIYVNENSREDKGCSKNILIKLLDQGEKVMIFPEGTWNYSENEIIYDIAYGTADMAIQTGACVLPIAIEQCGKKFVINAGNKMDFVGMDKQQATRMLRDEMAALRWKIWEKQGIESRKAITDEYWRDFIQSRRKEWKGYSVREQIINTYIPQYKKEYLEVQKMLKPNEMSLRFKTIAEESSLGEVFD